MVGKLSFFVGCCAAAYVFFRVLPEIRAHRSVMKEMDTDSDGNYDLDGVSYDPSSHNVVVTGDGRIPDPVETVVVVKEVVTLHAPEEPKKRDIQSA